MALSLFFCGLIVFLFNNNTALAHIMLIFSILAFFVYVLLTSLPIFFYDCPYGTPLTFNLSYIIYAIAAYRLRRRRHHRKASLNQWKTTHLTAMWAQGGREQGTELDHTALRWTLLALTDTNDLELFVMPSCSPTLTLPSHAMATALLRRCSLVQTCSQRISCSCCTLRSPRIFLH